MFCGSRPFFFGGRRGEMALLFIKVADPCFSQIRLYTEIAEGGHVHPALHPLIPGTVLYWPSHQDEMWECPIYIQYIHSFITHYFFFIGGHFLKSNWLYDLQQTSVDIWFCETLSNPPIHLFRYVTICDFRVLIPYLSPAYLVQGMSLKANNLFVSLNIGWVLATPL